MLDRLSGWVSGLLGRRPASAAAASGDTSALVGTFEEALRTVSPDFERYCRLAGDEAAETAARSVYAALPITGKVSRTAVARELLVRLAGESEDEEDVKTLSGLSDRQIAIVARRAGVPI